MEFVDSVTSGFGFGLGLFFAIYSVLVLLANKQEDQDYGRERRKNFDKKAN